MASQKTQKQQNFSPFRERVYEIIFEADTPAGKWFDIILLVFIIASVMVVMLETVPSLEDSHKRLFVALEWIFTIFFTIEYFVRIYTVHSPKKYITSFYGVVDLISILPTYISLFMVGTQSLMIIRALRLLRVFRIFKLGSFLIEGQIILKALKESKDKILVFLFFILVMVTIFGSAMYLIEHNYSDSENGFTSIPRSIYWAIVTLTTVGYGDISPQTALGQFIASVIMIMGYAVIAVPTGIMSSELSKGRKRKASAKITSQVCSFCLKEGHDPDADYCKFCGGHLHIAADMKKRKAEKEKKG